MISSFVVAFSKKVWGQNEKSRGDFTDVTYELKR